MDRSILLCVATEKGYEVLQAVHKAELGVNIHVSTFKETKVSESFYDDIQSYAKNNELPVHSWQSIKNGGEEWLQENRIWAVVCVGWRFLLPENLVSAVNKRVIVTHDSLLPKYRGFAPLATAFINGEDEVGVSVLFAAPEVDDGDILYQKAIQVTPQDTIKTLITRLLPYFCEGVVSSLRGLLAGTLTGKSQDRSQATFSLWRDEDDLWIDWNSSADYIDRFIRALGPPYLGAKTRMENSIITITNAYLTNDLNFEIRQPGKIWSLTEKGEPVVVCGSGMLVVTEAFCSNNAIIPLNKLRVRFGGENP